ncbi:MAG: tRNA (adenosine(37)-N6)-threonylcarbamoyltransferase complex ATPase subunit type 1 TsaE [bacterium]|nr:tRNA (adenosine(37)-N6)-threonylcarbamoyltransferase complex ATPase subunit type 1 TsaE [bacterium]
MVIFSRNPEETINIGKEIASYLKKGDTIAFTGELGSGKTTMIKGIVKELTGCEATSPSFVLINEYPGPLPVFHFDLYRLKCKIEMETFGWEEYLDKGIVLIEWADKIYDILPKKTIFISISLINSKRKIIIKGLKGRIKDDKQRKSVKGT